VHVVNARLAAALLLTVACSRESQVATNTIAPAESRPAEPITSTIGTQPVITTAGSPPPPTQIAPGMERIAITTKGIAVRPLLPRGHTAFRITNETAVAHALVLRGGGQNVNAALPANGTIFLQSLIGEGAYEIVCTAPAHSERARFETYRAGVPITR
jgi:hypothetical protein